MSDDFDPDEIQVFEDETDDGYVRIKKDDLKKVRTAARRAGSATRELNEFRQRDTARDKAKDAGLTGLNDRQVAALAREAGDDQSPENLRKIATDFGWAQAQAEPTEEEREAQEQNEREIEQHTEAAAIANGAPAVAHRTLQPSEVNGWAPDRLMRLQKSHPDLYELVLREEPITLPAGFN
jgi:hypothetical protein